MSDAAAPTSSPARRVTAIEARRDLVADLYARLQTERAVAQQLGIAAATVHRDLEERGVPRGPQARGLKRGLASAEDLERLQDGNRRYRAEVERVKVDRRLMGVDELLERLARARVPRSPYAIDLHVRAGLITPERGLGFDKPQLYTVTAVDELITRLRDYPDGRLRRFNATTQESARFRAHWYEIRHKSTREWGRLATVINRAGPKLKMSPEEEAMIVDLRAKGWTQQEIVIAVGVTLKQVRGALHRAC
jgi:hypothetical protein